MTVEYETCQKWNEKNFSVRCQAYERRKERSSDDQMLPEDREWRCRCDVGMAVHFIGWRQKWSFANYRPSLGFVTSVTSFVGRGDLFVSRANTSIGQRSFSIAAPMVWNALPPDIRSPHNSRHVAVPIKAEDLLVSTSLHCMTPLENKSFLLKSVFL